MTLDLTNEEQRAIKGLRALAKRWPDSLWLFSASGSLYVMKKKNGKHAVDSGGNIDSDYMVDIIHGIDNDGGDW
jgi:hypothetical protein